MSTPHSVIEIYNVDEFTATKMAALNAYLAKCNRVVIGVRMVEHPNLNPKLARQSVDFITDLAGVQHKRV